MTSRSDALGSILRLSAVKRDSSTEREIAPLPGERKVPCHLSLGNRSSRIASIRTSEAVFAWT